MEQRETVLDLVATDRKIGGAAEPEDGPLAQVCELVVVRIGPCEVDAVGSHRLCIVVGKQARVLVSTFSNPLEPGCEARVEARPLRRRQALVRDLARQRVLDRPLALAHDRRADR